MIHSNAYTTRAAVTLNNLNDTQITSYLEFLVEHGLDMANEGLFLLSNNKNLIKITTLGWGAISVASFIAIKHN